MTFQHRSWKHRQTLLGDEAEKVFETVWTTAWDRYGMLRPKISMAALPAHMRYTPDYITSECFVEVQGLGQDRIFKLKLDKYVSLNWWNDVHPVRLFAWDLHMRQWGSFELRNFDHALRNAKVELFPEGKAYFAVPVEHLPVLEWTTHESG